jgi:hypothetical protein
MALSLSIDLGQTDNFSNQPNKTLCQNTRIVGFISDQKKSINPPIYLKSRPNNNSFSVKILTETGIVATTPYDYVLILDFQKM